MPSTCAALPEIWSDITDIPSAAWHSCSKPAIPQKLLPPFRIGFPRYNLNTLYFSCVFSVSYGGTLRT